MAIGKFPKPPSRKHTGTATYKLLPVDTLTELFIERAHAHIRSDNGPEFTAIRVRRWIERLGSRTVFIEPGSRWENGYIESFKGKMRDELLNAELFDTLLETKVLTDAWRKEYNHFRPHSSLGYRPPAPEAILPRPAAYPIASGLTLNLDHIVGAGHL